MARIYPFRALRYNPSLVRVEDCVTQPYDKITPAMQQGYYRKSPYNLVRVVLGLPELFDSETDGVYTRAANDFKAWRGSGVLAAEAEPCVYAYAQRFTVPNSNGAVAERRGFIALGELYDYAQKVVFRHEQTLEKPKADRLNLLRTTRAHFGQIFMLYSDPGKSAERLLFSGNNVPEIELTDEYGVLHRVWKVSDPATINLLAGTLEDKKLIIADGHHRYETALAYAKERAPAEAVSTVRRSQSLPQPAYPEAAAMMTFVNMDSDGLVILPTHRVVTGLASFSPAAFFEKARDLFDIEECAATDTDALLAKLATAGHEKTAFLAVTKSGSRVLTAKSAQLRERHTRLDVAQLHALAIERLLGVQNPDHLQYLRDAGEAAGLVQRGEANIAFLMNPATIDEVREAAFAGETMPQKSTDFFPKLLTGLTIYALD